MLICLQQTVLILLCERQVMCFVVNIYDSLDLIALVIFHGRVFLQSIWKHELSWDDKMPELLSQEHWKLLKVLQNLSLIKIPRFSVPCQHNLVLKYLRFLMPQLNAVYLHVIHALVFLQSSFSKMRLALVTSKKKRVKKLSEITLPRLGVLIGVHAEILSLRNVSYSTNIKKLSTDGL